MRLFVICILIVSVAFPLACDNATNDRTAMERILQEGIHRGDSKDDVEKYLRSKSLEPQWQSVNRQDPGGMLCDWATIAREGRPRLFGGPYMIRANLYFDPGSATLTGYEVSTSEKNPL